MKLVLEKQNLEQNLREHSASVKHQQAVENVKKRKRQPLLSAHKGHPIKIDT